jgi:uncharacterized membrane protein YcaP (DUF421 family)
MRILFGEVPPNFLLEAVIRIVFIYLLLMFSMRLMGNRMGSMLTRNEMIALVSLAAANGVSLMSPDRGLLPVIIIAIIVIGYQRLIAWWSFRNKRFESLVLDDLDTLVKDGHIQLDKVERVRLTRERLLARFRVEGIDNLGKIQRAYQEANGAFSILKYQEPKIGLSIIPDCDEEFKQEQRKAAGHFACGSCGNLVQKQQKPETPCERCSHQEWEEAVVS